MAKNSKLIFKIIPISLLLIFARCASQLPPGGGELDKIPPRIDELFPGNGTINFHEDYFEITFSEYVDKRSAQEAIFISPALQKPLKFDWSGRTLTVYFNDTLKANTTYTVSIGTDVKDVSNGNKMAEAFTFAFSSGNKIDKGEISGKVYDDKNDGVMVFAYKNNGNTIDPGKVKPDYVSQVGTNGKYKILGVGDGSYSVFAIRDKFRDLLYQKNEDGYGVQFKNVELKDKFIQIENVDFFLTSDDTISPNISNVFTRDRNHLLITFSKNVDSTKISSSNFFLFDSTANKKVLPKYFFKGDGRANQFYLAFTDTMEKKDGWVLVSKDIPDLKLNLSSEEKTSLFVKPDRDTNAAKLINISGTMPENKVDYENPKLKMTFNDAVDISTVQEKTIIQDAKGNKLPFEVERLDDAAFSVNLLQNLKQSTEYILKLDLKNYNDVFGNKVDSLFQNKFITSSELDFSGASGTVAVNDTIPTVVVLESVSSPKKVYQQKVNVKNQFDFKKVNPGKYLAWGFKDKNKNNKYNYGTILPFKLSEEFKYFPDTLNLRARWPVGNITIDFKK